MRRLLMDVNSPLLKLQLMIARHLLLCVKRQRQLPRLPLLKARLLKMVVRICA